MGIVELGGIKIDGNNKVDRLLVKKAIRSAARDITLYKEGGRSPVHDDLEVIFQGDVMGGLRKAQSTVEEIGRRIGISEQEIAALRLVGTFEGIVDASDFKRGRGRFQS